MFQARYSKEDPDVLAEDSQRATVVFSTFQKPPHLMHSTEKIIAQVSVDHERFFSYEDLHLPAHCAVLIWEGCLPPHLTTSIWLSKLL